MKVSTRFVAAALTLLVGLLAALPLRRSSAPKIGRESADFLRLPSADAREMQPASPLVGVEEERELGPTADALAGDSLPMADESAASELGHETNADHLTRRSSSVSISPASERDKADLAGVAEETLPMDGPLASQLEAPELSRRFPSALAETVAKRPLAPVDQALAFEPLAAARGDRAPANQEYRSATHAAAEDVAAVATPQLVIKRHRIRDGDTLEKLALRYLGSADRRHELFEQNRDVLADPYLLPIGKELSVLVPADTVRED